MKLARAIRWLLLASALSAVVAASVATVVGATEPGSESTVDESQESPETSEDSGEGEETSTTPDGSGTPTTQSTEPSEQEGTDPGSEPATEPSAEGTPAPSDLSPASPGEGDGTPAEAEQESANEADDDAEAEAPALSAEEKFKAATAGTDPFTQAGIEAIHSAGLGRQHTPSPLIIPYQTIPLRFSHALHVSEMDCTDCHDAVEDSIRSADNNLPVEEGCFDCHDPNEGMTDPMGGDPPARCSTCHPGYQAVFPDDVDDFEETHRAKVGPLAVHLPQPNLKFNHKVHIQKGIGCDTCHGDLSDKDFVVPETVFPVMGTCLTCHDGKEAPDECRTCHLTQPDGRIDTGAAGVPLKPAGWYFADAHDEAFLKNHRRAAQMNEGYCANCHEPKECIDCHNGVSKPLRIHPNNWILQHPIAARRNTPDCASCHRSQTYCIECHQSAKVTWEPAVTPTTAGVVASQGSGQVAFQQRNQRFHPEGWADYGQRGPNHHSFQAQRNIRACVSCHTEQTCTKCHASSEAGRGGWGVNPHPVGFAGSAQCRGMLQRNGRACVKCHTADSAELSLCR